MTFTAAQRLRVLIETVLERHHDIATAIEELAHALDDEIDARVCDRIADLREQLERGGNS